MRKRAYPLSQNRQSRFCQLSRRESQDPSASAYASARDDRRGRFCGFTRPGQQTNAAARAAAKPSADGVAKKGIDFEEDMRPCPLSAVNIEKQRTCNPRPAPFSFWPGRGPSFFSARRKERWGAHYAPQTRRTGRDGLRRCRRPTPHRWRGSPLLPPSWPQARNQRPSASARARAERQSSRANSASSDWTAIRMADFALLGRMCSS